MFVEQESVLTRTSVWEYSPSTGAFSIGYTEYNAGLKVGDILVFVDKDGDRWFTDEYGDRSFMWDYLS